MRLDKYLVDQQLFPSREKAQTAIRQRTVMIDGRIATKASQEVNNNMYVEVIDIFNKYVSMGGLKLEKAIQTFGLEFRDKWVLDIGSSTGGFTDCALQHGAAHVVAVDVGTQQLADSLRHDERVTSLENKDFRNLTSEEIQGRQFDFIVSDVSFISLTYILPYCAQFLKPDGLMMLLIKPQFEAGPSFLSRGGIVNNEKGYKVAISKVVEEALNQGFHLHGIAVSTLFEIHKNVEFLSLFSQQADSYHLDLNKLCDEVKEVKNQIK